VMGRYKWLRDFGNNFCDKFEIKDKSQYD